MYRKLTMAALVVMLVAASLLISAAPAVAQSNVTVVVQRGDTLRKIAARYCTDWQTVYTLNRWVIGPNPNIISPGMVLTVPNECGGAPGNPGGVWDRGPRKHAMGSFQAPFYTVVRGDTLTSIGLRFGTTANAIKRANNLTSNTIFAGWRLLIPGSGGNPGPLPPTPVPPPAGTERVSFAPGTISATRSGSFFDMGQRRYLLAAQAGQTMEVYTISSGVALLLTVTGPDGSQLAASGPNGGIQNGISVWLPRNGDYTVTVTPVEKPWAESRFDITFVIR